MINWAEDNEARVYTKSYRKMTLHTTHNYVYIIFAYGMKLKVGKFAIMFV